MYKCDEGGSSVFPGAGLSVFMAVMCSYRSALLFYRAASPPKATGLNTPGESEPIGVWPQICTVKSIGPQKPGGKVV